MAIDYLSLGKRIQNRRKLCGITQERLTEVISVTVGYISQIERSITKVNLETLSKIAEHLDCEIIDFLDGTTKKDTFIPVRRFKRNFCKTNVCQQKDSFRHF